MEIVFHYPESEDGKRALAESAALEHFYAVAAYIRTLQIPEEEKGRIAAEVYREYIK